MNATVSIKIRHLNSLLVEEVRRVELTVFPVGSNPWEHPVDGVFYENFRYETEGVRYVCSLPNGRDQRSSVPSSLVREKQVKYQPTVREWVEQQFQNQTILSLQIGKETIVFSPEVFKVWLNDNLVEVDWKHLEFFRGMMPQRIGCTWTEEQIRVLTPMIRRTIKSSRQLPTFTLQVFQHSLDDNDVEFDLIAEDFSSDPGLLKARAEQLVQSTPKNFRRSYFIEPD